MKTDIINHKGYSIEIEPAEFPENPREWDNLGKMVCFHSRYDIGDKHDYKADDYSNWNELEADIIDTENPVCIYPVYLYDHSGLRIKIGSFSNLPQGHAEFDSGQVGFIYVTEEDIKKWYLVKSVTPEIEKRVEKALRAEIETYDNYLSGEVFGYEIKAPNGEHLDSCWGFYGYDFEDNGLLEDAKNCIKYHIKSENPLFAYAGILEQVS